MSEINDGGPAFAATYEEYDQDMERWRIVSSGGMTLRDFFAAKALPGVIQMVSDGKHEPSITDLPIQPEDFIAKTSYDIADAMLRAREAA